MDKTPNYFKFAQTPGINLIKKVEFKINGQLFQTFLFCGECGKQYYACDDDPKSEDFEWNNLYKQMMGIPDNAPRDWCSECLINSHYKEI